METSRICPGCKKPLPTGAPDGLCPECLLKAGLGTEVEIGPETQAESSHRPFVAPAPEAIGRHFPQLEIFELLGQGGMAAVYKARQPHLNRMVALKLLATGKEQDPAFAERFTREAQMLARLNHPNIVTLYDFGKVDGLYYLLMEYVDGVSLRQLMHTKKLSPEQALAIVPKICEALQFAHEHGVVHRDVKPENVLLNQEGRVKIADFGIAKMVGDDGKQPAITRDEQVIGTPHYMAPEQVEHPQRVDHRADIYSLGVVFYEMLTGELPLGKFQPPSRKVRVDVRLDEIVLHALEKEPELRYQHASQVKTDVETVAGSPSPPVVAAESKPRSRAGRGLAGVLVGTRRGFKAISWLGVVQEWLAVGGLAGLLFFAFTRFAGMNISLLESCIVMLFPAVLWVAFWVFRCWTMPQEELAPLDRPPAQDQGQQTPECRIPGTSLSLLESQHGRRMVHWGNVSLAWVLLMLAGGLGLAMVALVANLLGYYIAPRVFLNAGVLMSFAAAFVLGVIVRRAWLAPARPPASALQLQPSPTPHIKHIETARELVRWPSTGLLGIGLCFPVIAGLFVAFSNWPTNAQCALGLVCVGLLDYAVLLGSWRMRQLRDYRLAVLAAVLTLLIALPGFLLAIFPIWALMVLHRPDVRAAFDELARERASRGATKASLKSQTL